MKLLRLFIYPVVFIVVCIISLFTEYPIVKWFIFATVTVMAILGLYVFYFFIKSPISFRKEFLKAKRKLQNEQNNSRN